VTKREKILVAAAAGLVAVYGGILLFRGPSRPAGGRRSRVDRIAREFSGRYVPGDAALADLEKKRVFATDSPTFLVDTLSGHVADIGRRCGFAINFKTLREEPARAARVGELGRVRVGFSGEGDLAQVKRFLVALTEDEKCLRVASIDVQRADKNERNGRLRCRISLDALYRAGTEETP
jgi:hypothetical protein